MSYKEWALANPTKTYNYFLALQEISDKESEVRVNQNRLAIDEEARKAFGIFDYGSIAASFDKTRTECAQNILQLEVEIEQMKSQMTSFVPDITDWRKELYGGRGKSIIEWVDDGDNGIMKERDFGGCIRVNPIRLAYHLARMLYPLLPSFRQDKFNPSTWTSEHPECLSNLVNIIQGFYDSRGWWNARVNFTIYSGSSYDGDYGNLVSIGDSDVHFTRGGQLSTLSEAFMLAWLTYLDYRWDYLISELEGFEHGR